jgi:hypothetical protein
VLGWFCCACVTPHVIGLCRVRYNMGVPLLNFESIVKEQGPHHEMRRNVVNVDPNILFLWINYIRLIIYRMFKCIVI